MGLGWQLDGPLGAIANVDVARAKARSVIGQFASLTFGKQAINRKDLTHQGDIGTGALGLAGYVIGFTSVCHG